MRKEQDKLKTSINVMRKVQEDETGISMMDATEQTLFQEESDRNNFLDKSVVDQIMKENFDHSVFIRYLKGTTGGNSRLKSIWKPNKFTFTKKGPKIDETLYENTSKS